MLTGRLVSKLGVRFQLLDRSCDIVSERNKVTQIR